jgi:hypothetical protein
VGRPPKAASEHTKTEISESDYTEQAVVSPIQTHQEPEISTKQSSGIQMTIPIVDGTESGLKGAKGTSTDNEPMMDMTAMMAGGGK